MLGCGPYSCDFPTNAALDEIQTRDKYLNKHTKRAQFFSCLLLQKVAIATHDVADSSSFPHIF